MPLPFRWLTIACLALVPAFLGLAASEGSAQTRHGARAVVTCHSNNNEYQRCNIHNWQGIELIRQVSRTPCVRGDNWGVDGEWLWVSGGCRADFGEVSRPWRHDPERGRGEILMDRTVSCHSNHREFRRCQVGLWDDVALVQQDSDTRCVRGDNWGLDGTAVWVTGGCRGVFAEVRHRTLRRHARDRRHGRQPAAQFPPSHAWDRDIEFVCQSRDQHYKLCQVDVGPRGWVELKKRESGAECIRGRSWGWNRAGIWVDRGCRARFVVHRRR